jgi:calcineurin-like phosphoesterase family protein
MKTFITSDTFFSRPDALDLGTRSGDFINIKQMDDTLISNWNDVVSPDDLVYHLGNFCWDPISADLILRKLNGKIIFFAAKYDGALSEVISQFIGKHAISVTMISWDKKLNSVLSHWPMLNWPGKDKNTYHFHGGIGEYPTNLEEDYRVNASIDHWNYAPLDIDVITDIIKDVKKLKKL